MGRAGGGTHQTHSVKPLYAPKKNTFSALCRQHNILKPREGSWNCILCPLHCKALAGHHRPFARQAHVPWQVPVSLPELWHEGAAAKILFQTPWSRCSLQDCTLPTLPPAQDPVQAVKQVKKVNRHEHPYFGGRSSTMFNSFGNFSALSLPPTASRSPSCRQLRGAGKLGFAFSEWRRKQTMPGRPGQLARLSPMHLHSPHVKTPAWCSSARRWTTQPLPGCLATAEDTHALKDLSKTEPASLNSLLQFWVVTKQTNEKQQEKRREGKETSVLHSSGSHPERSTKKRAGLGAGTVAGCSSGPKQVTPKSQTLPARYQPLPHRGVPAH